MEFVFGERNFSTRYSSITTVLNRLKVMFQSECVYLNRYTKFGRILAWRYEIVAVFRFAEAEFHLPRQECVGSNSRIRMSDWQGQRAMRSLTRHVLTRNIIFESEICRELYSLQATNDYHRSPTFPLAHLEALLNIIALEYRRTFLSPDCEMSD